MFTNPFSPVFGGKPTCFFGRKDLLDRFDLAMKDPGSEDRALFLTGARGSGKTALVEQFSRKAASKGRKVIDLGPENTVELLVKALVGYDETTRTLNPQASASILGMGGSLSVGSESKTIRYGREDLQQALLSACEREKKGVLITIDEVQKVDEPDISAVCNAFQMASRKGYDAIIVVAGLPYAHERIIGYEGCTFMRRAVHDEIGLFSYEEAHDALFERVLSIRGLEIGDSLLEQLVDASMGHPYLMQLLGYYLVLELNEREDAARVQATQEDVSSCIKTSLRAFERRALAPMVDELSDAETTYLRTMADIMKQEGRGRTVVRSRDVAQKMGKEQRQLSMVRDRLIRLGIIAAPERGYLTFCIPYLRAYVQKEKAISNTAVRAISWGV